MEKKSNILLLKNTDGSCFASFFKRPKMRQRQHSIHHVGSILLSAKSERGPLISPVFEPNLHTLSLTTSLTRILLQNKRFATFVYKAHHTDKLL